MNLYRPAYHNKNITIQISRQHPAPISATTPESRRSEYILTDTPVILLRAKQPVHEDDGSAIAAMAAVLGRGRGLEELIGELDA